MDRELLLTLKALSDASRLRIVGLLAARPYAVEDLAAAVELSAGTVVHHLKRLRTAGLVDARPSHPYVVYSLKLDALQRLGRQLDDLEHAADATTAVEAPIGGEPRPASDEKILRAFIVDGRLTSIPAQEKKREVILRFLLDRCFAEDRPYPEKEVNQLLALYHPDVAALRRYLVDGKLMTREAGVYRRATARRAVQTEAEREPDPARAET